ncbi:MAG: hypothetical protein LBT42_07180, partial [Tannerella sp.]|nr:hypothetical protein [Tannerella sp.]
MTDGIFSPGRGVNAENYLVNQQIGIKNQVSDYLKRENNGSVIVYQLTSKFDGTYYNKVDAPITINGQRPFYIYIFGDTKLLNVLRDRVPESRFNDRGVLHMHTFSAMAGNQEVKYAINPSIGTFEKSRTNPQTTIKNLAKDSRTGQVKFAVNVDFSGLLLDDDYLTNSDNYENSSKYDLE